jgi:integrase
MSASVLLDAAGRRRSPATLPGRHCGRPPRNDGRQYPADPPTVEEVIAVMRSAGVSPAGLRVRALIVILWRAGLRISEALALAESDLDRTTGAVLVRRGKGGKRREVGMDRWGWQQLDPWPNTARRCRSEPCSASCTDRPPAGPGRHRRHEPRCVTSPSWPGSGDVSRRTNFAMRTQSRWPARASRSRWFSANLSREP